MAEKENTLKLNPENRRYEGAYTITFQVEAEIVRRALFRYAEENNIDPANITEWEKAIEAITRASKWIDHPRSKWLDFPYAKPAHEQPGPIPEAKQEPSVSVASTPQPAFTGHTTKPLQKGQLSSEDEAMLREVAMCKSVDEWENLLTPLPTNLPPGKGKRRIYIRRYAERQALNRLKAELEPATTSTLHTIVSAVNGSRIH